MAILSEVNVLLSEKGLSMKRGTVVDATLIAAPSSTQNADKRRASEMTQTKKGNQWHFGMKAHIGVDAESGLIHTVACTTTKVADITMIESCLHGEERLVLGDRGYHKKNRTLDVFEKEGSLSILTPSRKPAKGTLTKKQKAFNRLLSAIWAVVEHSFRVVKRQFGYAKVRYRGGAKDTVQIVPLLRWTICGWRAGDCCPSWVRYARETGNAGQNPGISQPADENRQFFIDFMTICTKMAGCSENL